VSLQFGRKWTLLVTPVVGGQGVDLSPLRITFRTYAADVPTPARAIIKVYNIDPRNARNIMKGTAGSEVTLQAGYEPSDNVGVIFKGQLMQSFYARESPTDTYLELIAADGDLAHVYGTLNATLAAGSTAEQRLRSYVQQVKISAPDPGFGLGYAKMIGPVLPRGKVQYGMGPKSLRDWANTNGNSIAIVDGQVQTIDRGGYLPGEAIELNAKSGMIGMPRQTDQGIEVACLINPKLRLGGVVRLNNADVVPAEIDVSYSAINSLAKIHSDADGFYRIFVREFIGDTRGGEDSPWYARLTCLAIDKSSIIGDQVAG
jgi:hypothetical protein